MKVWKGYVSHTGKEYQGRKGLWSKWFATVKTKGSCRMWKRWEEKGSPGSGTETAAWRRCWLGGGGLGCFSKVIRKSRLSHKRVPFAEEILGLPTPWGLHRECKGIQNILATLVLSLSFYVYMDLGSWLWGRLAGMKVALGLVHLVTGALLLQAGWVLLLIRFLTQQTGQRSQNQLHSS